MIDMFKFGKSYRLILMAALVLSAGIVFLVIKNIGENKASYGFLSPLGRGGVQGIHSQRVSGWVAWWDGQQAYSVIDRNPDKFETISPVWFMLDENFQLKEVSEDDFESVVSRLHELGIKVYPSLGTELSGEEFSPFVNDSSSVDEFIDVLIARAVDLQVDGIDIDLEGIKESDKDKFTELINKTVIKAHENNLKVSIAVHARGWIVRWEGVLGQDLRAIGRVVDEVRIMTYDFHSPGGDAGPIAPFNWMREVAIYNAFQMDRRKIVIGIPSYGYIWTKDDTVGYQHMEFIDHIAGMEYESKRDYASNELIVRNEDMEGWLSDADAMIAKMDKMRSLGFNRFVIWHIGGLDESLFEKL
jgi:spore germination protein